MADGKGTRIGEIPFEFSTAHGPARLSATVDASGRRVTAEPIDGWVTQRQVNTQIGAGIGAAIGASLPASDIPNLWEYEAPAPYYSPRYVPEPDNYR